MAYNLIGNRYGKLEVIEKSEKKDKHGRTYWTCVCECGNTKDIMQQSLIAWKSTSCGCNHPRLKHGMWKDRLFKIWISIKVRCNCPSNKDYPNYGGRGIKICEEWQKDFLIFYNWAITNGYSKDLSIDRIDVNGNYEPSNCRWANAKTQANNRTNTIYLNYQGVKKNLSEWSESTNIPIRVLRKRKSKGWDVEKILTTPYCINKAHLKGEF